MHQRMIASLAAALLVLPVAARAADVLPQPVAAALASERIATTSVAAYVHEVGAARPVLAVNAVVPMNPASTMKLVTTLAALDLLGPTYRWKTEAYVSGVLKGEALDGDLVLRGLGDPKLTVENFWLMLRALRQRGLRDIHGDLVLDRSWFDARGYDPSRFDNQPMRPYNVGPDALLVNFKAFRFTFVPDPGRGRVLVAVEPRSSQLEMALSPQLADGPCGDWRARLRADFRANGGSATAAFGGAYAESCGENTWNVAMLSHPDFVYGTFRALWEELGGSLRGRWKEGAAAAGAKPIYVQESPALAEVVRDINKFSNNVMARQLFLTISAEMTKAPGRAERSAEVIRSWLARKGLEASELVIENGSGLSREDRISAGNMGKLLLLAYASPFMPEFIASMPLVAFDGTMKRRLKFDSVAGHAHIKTGSLADARTLAGYVLDRRGRRFVVAFFVNHVNAAASQPAQDAMLKWVYDQAARSSP